MQADEEAVYNFCNELHTKHSVSDAHYQAVLDLFGEQGVVDLMVVSGYYVMVAMALNVNRSPLPEGAVPIPELGK
jgi:4-carboxymuconolactone decarboxylase